VWGSRGPLPVAEAEGEGERPPAEAAEDGHRPAG